MMKLGEVCAVQSGIGFPTELQGETGGIVPFYKVSDMNLPGNEQTMGVSNNYVSRATMDSQRWKAVSKNTVIFPKIGAAIATNKKRMLSVDSLYDNNVMGLTCTEYLRKNFLFFLMCDVDLMNWASSSNPPSIRKETVERFEIPLPPLSVQEEIVSEIDSYQKIIDGARQVVENYKPTIKIGPEWDTVKLGDVCELQAGGTPLRSVDDYWNSNDYPWYTSGELNTIYTSEPDKYISQEGLRCSSARVFPTGSLLIGMYDTAAFKMSILDRDATFNQAVCGVKPSAKFDMLFLLLFFSGKRDVYLNMRVGARQRNLTKQLISELDVPLLPIETQREIVARISEEMEIVNQNKRLIEIFQQKTKDKISEVWGQ